MFGKKNKPEKDARGALIQAATKLFAEHGFEAVSTRMLAQEAGVNLAMIAYYFGSKEKLFESMIAEKFPQTKEMLLNIYESPLEPWEKFRAVIIAYLDRIFSNPSFSRLIHRELSLLQRPLNSERILNGIAVNWDIMAKIIEEGQQKGVFKPDIDVAMTLISIFGTIGYVVNTPCMAARQLGFPNENDIASEPAKNRVKTHLEKMIQTHLLIHPV